MPFQLNAKNIFLTYPKCGLPLPIMLAFFVSGCNPEYAVVSSEKHEDGSLHRHALLQFSKPFRTRSETIFDIQGFHPNIQSARNPAATDKYVKKDQDFIEHGSFLGKPEKEPVDVLSITAAAGEMDLGPFLVWASVNRVMYAKDIWSALRQVDTHTIPSNEGLYNVLDPAFIKLLESHGGKIKKTKAIVLVGASGIGKTTWAKLFATKPCLFVNHTDSLKEFRAGYHKSIIFDDVSFKHTPITNQIALCDFDNPRSIHCRHRVANIPAGIMKIFTCNDPPLELEHDAIARRIYLIRCDYGHLKEFKIINTI